MLDVRRLRVLHAVVTSGSMAAAASELAYTPSAVSQHLSALEREAGTPLLERVGRGVRPTKAGQLLAERAGDLLGQLAQTEAALSDLRTGRAGTLTMTFFATAGPHLVPPALAQFRRRHPNVELHLNVCDPPDSVTNVQAGDIDLAVSVANGHEVTDDTDGLAWTHLMDDRYELIVPAGHHLAGRGEVNLADLSEETWVDTDAVLGPCREITDAGFAAAGFQPRVSVATDDYGTTQGMVAAGLGLAIAPRLALRLRHPGISVVHLTGNPIVRSVYVVVRAGAVEDPLLRTMCAVLVRSANTAKSVDESLPMRPAVS